MCTSPNTATQGLSGISAQEAVLAFLESPGSKAPRLDDQLISRVLNGLTPDSSASAADKAVLVRQIIQHYFTEDIDREIALADEQGWPANDQWAEFGMSARKVGDRLIVKVLPWSPEWLSFVPPAGVGATAARAETRNLIIPEEPDPFLDDLNVPSYRSRAQQMSIRAALTAPPKSTLLITLPTGEGKSLIYHAVARFGYEDRPGPDGVTLVIVPTISLAVDQDQVAATRGLTDRPRAFLGGDPNGTNQQIIDAVTDGTQGLVFAAPESVSAIGRLRIPLERAASNGYMRVLVIDEAHLVNAWGANFRPEFQALSGFRRELIARSPRGSEPRTILLSATVTAASMETLQTLFEDKESEFGVVSGTRLRPEIEYWSASESSESVRRGRVEQALMHLPRPAILYTTRVDDARWWYARARELGFRRLAHMTGKTPSSERGKIVSGWRSGAIDLVIGTSAFGLGIDNSHVRSVIHACVPESLDRYYQEIGRSGRDGRGSISLVIPTYEDRAIAESLSRTPLIGLDKGFNRWKAMFHHPDSNSTGRGEEHRLRIDIPPQSGVGYMDMVGDQNTAWNQRTVAMLANTGLLQLNKFETLPIENLLRSEDAPGDGNPSDEPAEYGHFQTIVILDQMIHDISAWKERVEPYRRQQALNFAEGLGSMYEVLSGAACVASTLAKTYRVRSDDARAEIYPSFACGGCAHCRRSAQGVTFTDALPPHYPWSVPEAESTELSNMVDHSGRGIVFIPRTGLSRRNIRLLTTRVAQLASSGLRSFVVTEAPLIDFGELRSILLWKVMFISNPEVRDRLPPGPRVFMTTSTKLQDTTSLDVDRNGFPLIFLLPEDTVNPDRPDRLLQGNTNIRDIPLHQFLERRSI